MFGSSTGGVFTFDFIPFGMEHGDRRLPRVDDESSDEIVLSTEVVIFGSTQDRLFVSHAIFIYSDFVVMKPFAGKLKRLNFIS